MSSETGVRLQSDLFNRGGYIKSSARYGLEIFLFFPAKQRNFRNSNGTLYITLGQKTVTECRASKCKAEPAESWDKKCRNPENQKAKNPIAPHEPVRQ